MKRVCRKLVILLLTVVILSPAAADRSKYVQLLQKIDYGSEVTYVIGHKSPDPDSVGSAIAFAELMNANGIQAVPAASERIDNKSAYALQLQEIYLQSGQDYLFCMVSDSGSTWLSWVGDGSEELVRESYEEYDGGEYIIFRPATTRKLKIVPPLVKVLENRDMK